MELIEGESYVSRIWIAVWGDMQVHLTLFKQHMVDAIWCMQVVTKLGHDTTDGIVTLKESSESDALKRVDEYYTGLIEHLSVQIRMRPTLMDHVDIKGGTEEMISASKKKRWLKMRPIGDVN